MGHKINGIDFVLQPTTSRWMERQILDYNGLGQPVYSSIREHEMRWNLSTMEATQQLKQFFKASATGTIVLELPWFYDPISGSYYGYQIFSGALLNEPGQGAFFTENVTEFVLLARIKE